MDGGDIDKRTIASVAAPLNGRDGRWPAAVASASAIAAIPKPRPPGPTRPDLANILIDRGFAGSDDMQRAQVAQRSVDLPLGQILLAQGVLTEAELLSALAEAHGMSVSSIASHAPDPGLAALMPATQAIALEAVPWRRIGAAVVIALSRPDRAAEIRAAMPAHLRVILTMAARDQIVDAQISLYGEGLARISEGQVPLRDSCRAWRPGAAGRSLLAAAIALLSVALVAPVLATGLLFGLAFLIFAGNMTLKLAAFAATLRADRAAPDAAPPPPTALLRPPVVTLLVPLYKEREIASTLVANLSKLDYPPERLDVIFAVEADDQLTQCALNRCALPPWVRVVQVPPGTPRTKPRALNFAMNFARGTIVGIYDAEDRPDRDQITRVVQRFAEVPADVACLQGRLDYYNSGHNWLARSFSIEYASWFRVLLPGVQRLGLFVPLGGTTLFIRRDVLAEVGGWDAHNVTEDAELGLRLARKGYRTEMVDTTTFEEANAALWPWIGQRSRWQKGYLMTWATAMRTPRALWQDLGAKRFFALHVQILFAVAGFLVAPLLWSLAVKPFGIAHPLDALLTPTQYGLLAAVMVASLLSSLAIGIHATRAPHLRRLRPWILVTELYYLFATISAWRATIEMLIWPFWWVKTTHGRFGGADPEAEAEAEVATTHQA